MSRSSSRKKNFLFENIFCVILKAAKEFFFGGFFFFEN